MTVKICARSNVVGCVSSVHTQVPASMSIIKGNVPTGMTIVIIAIGEFAKNTDISLQLLVKNERWCFHEPPLSQMRKQCSETFFLGHGRRWLLTVSALHRDQSLAVSNKCCEEPGSPVWEQSISHHQSLTVMPHWPSGSRFLQLVLTRTDAVQQRLYHQQRDVCTWQWSVDFQFWFLNEPYPSRSKVPVCRLSMEFVPLHWLSRKYFLFTFVVVSFDDAKHETQRWI